ncbi:MAG: nucleotidyltransferase domain-containing protein [Methanobacterium sp.]|jgi:predicted nucleotidyltransferase
MMDFKTHKIDEYKRKKIKENIASALELKEEIIFAYIHGSFLEDYFRDVDVAIYLKKVGSKKEILQYELALERELEEIVGFPVDIRIINYAPLSFRFKVIRDGVLLFSKDEGIRSDFESLSIVKYHDFNFIRKMYGREALGIRIR